MKHIRQSLLKDKRVDEVEGEGLDDNRFFVHLKPGFDWGYDPYNVTRSKSFGDLREARQWLKRVKRVS